MSVSFVQSSLNSTVCHLYRVEPVNVLFRLVGRSLIDIKAKFDCVVFLETIDWQRSVKREGHICYRTYIFMCVFFGQKRRTETSTENVTDSKKLTAKVRNSYEICKTICHVTNHFEVSHTFCC